MIITDLTKLDRDQIAKILRMSGYGSDDIDEVEYVSCIAGQLRYKIIFTDLEGEQEEGNVYISINSEGKLSAEY